MEQIQRNGGPRGRKTILRSAVFGIRASYPSALYPIPASKKAFNQLQEKQLESLRDLHVISETSNT
jgi:hypothetical protein